MKESEVENHKQIPFNIHRIEIETKCVTIRIFFNEKYPHINKFSLSLVHLHMLNAVTIQRIDFCFSFLYFAPFIRLKQTAKHFRPEKKQFYHGETIENSNNEHHWNS